LLRLYAGPAGTRTLVKNKSSWVHEEQQALDNPPTTHTHIYTYTQAINRYIIYFKCNPCIPVFGHARAQNNPKSMTNQFSMLNALCPTLYALCSMLYDVQYDLSKPSFTSHGIAWHPIVSHGIAWHRMVSHGIAWHRMVSHVSHCIEWLGIVIHPVAYSGIAWHVSHCFASYASHSSARHYIS
jgi:hypothetical protein